VGFAAAAAPFRKAAGTTVFRNVGGTTVSAVYHPPSPEPTPETEGPVDTCGSGKKRCRCSYPAGIVGSFCQSASLECPNALIVCPGWCGPNEIECPCLSPGGGPFCLVYGQHCPGNGRPCPPPTPAGRTPPANHRCPANTRVCQCSEGSYCAPRNDVCVPPTAACPPREQLLCICGQRCMTPDAEFGVCQFDNYTCSRNHLHPSCTCPPPPVCPQHTCLPGTHSQHQVDAYGCTVCPVCIPYSPVVPCPPPSCPVRCTAGSIPTTLSNGCPGCPRCLPPNFIPH